MSAKVLSKAAAKEAKIDLIEDGRGTQAVHDVSRGDARGAAFRFGQHEDQSRSRFVRRKAVAAKRNRSRPGRLQIVADLARRWRRFWPEAARLFEESCESPFGDSLFEKR